MFHLRGYQCPTCMRRFFWRSEFKRHWRRYSPKGLTSDHLWLRRFIWTHIRKQFYDMGPVYFHDQGPEYYLNRRYGSEDAQVKLFKARMSMEHGVDWDTVRNVTFDPRQQQQRRPPPYHVA